MGSLHRAWPHMPIETEESLSFAKMEPTIRSLIAELPVGCLPWDAMKELHLSPKGPWYFFILENSGINKLLQIKEPKSSLQFIGDSIKYFTGETLAAKKFFNRKFLPTYFVFDNYLHAYALEQRLLGIGWHVIREKFK
jgi:hypothetical protein